VSGVGIEFPGEQIFEAVKPIRYVFKRAPKPCYYMVVVLSGFSPVGSPPVYNYMRTLRPINCNKLFVLDNYGPRGCYYLGSNRSTDVQSAVISLIIHKANEMNIPRKNIISAGSSKGGFAALFYGIKYGFGHVIAGAPQTYLGNYLLQAARETMEYIAGDASEDSRLWLNDVLFNITENTSSFPDICIHVGEGDHHYQDHVLPFIEHLRKMGCEVEVDLGRFDNHGEIRLYQALLRRKIKEIACCGEVGPVIRELRVALIKRTDGYEIEAEIEVNDAEAQSAWYVLKQGQRVHVEWYGPSRSFSWKTKDPGVYRVQAFVKDKDENMDSMMSEEIAAEEDVNH